MNKPTAQDVIDFAALAQSVGVVTQWIDDVAALASDCLADLTADQQTMAIKYAVAAMLAGRSETGAGITSESLGDASTSYDTANNDAAKQYRTMALKVAPCLAGILIAKRYTARLVRP